MKKLILYAVDALTKPFDKYYLDKDTRNHERELKNGVIRLGESEEAKRIRRELFDNPAKKTRLTFFNLHNRADSREVEMLEDTQYALPGTPDYETEHDRIFHAKLTIKGYQNDSSELTVIEQKDIYMYQPRVICTTNGGTKKVFVGPKFMSNGNMNSSTCYCYKDSSGTLYFSTLPKREILSNKVFDFDKSNSNIFSISAHANFSEDADMLNKFISIEYDRDESGYIIPIPVEQERSVVENYQRPENHIDVENIISLLKRQIYQHKKNEKEVQEQIRKRESMRRVALNDATQESAPTQSEADRLNEENARILNDKLRYGIRTPGEQGLRMPGPGGGPRFGGPGGFGGMPTPPPPPPREGGPTLGRR